MLAAEREERWDAHAICENELTWLFGLLCLLEKPLLADQAGDLNTLLNILLKHRPSEGAAGIDINVCLITEYFE